MWAMTRRRVRCTDGAVAATRMAASSARCPDLDDESHGRWYFRIQVTGPNGRRKPLRKGGFTSRLEAQARMNEFLVLPGAEVLGRSWTVARFLRHWLAERERDLRPTTFRGYQRIVEEFLVPELGGFVLAGLRRKQVQRAFDRMMRRRTRTGRLVAPATVHGVRAVLRSALNQACRWGFREDNPALRLRLPKSGRVHSVVWLPARVARWRRTGLRPRVACWDLPQLDEFLAGVRDERLFAMWWLVAMRGLRRGELAGLRWSDLDFDSGELWVREQVIVLDGVAYIGPTKSAAGVRMLALDEETVKILLQWWLAECDRRGGVAPDGNDFLFTAVDGRGLRPDWITRRFKALITRLDLPPVRLHDVRHGAATLAGAAGVSVKVIQHDMGHASAVTTVDIYQKVFAETAHKAVRAMADLLLSQAKVRLNLGGASQA